MFYVFAEATTTQMQLISQRASAVAAAVGADLGKISANSPSSSSSLSCVRAVAR